MPNMGKISSLQGPVLFDKGCTVQSTGITLHVHVNQKRIVLRMIPLHTLHTGSPHV